MAIELQYIAPAIRRRILVPDTLTLGKLDRVIQAAMGWNNSHLHDFTIEGKRYGTSDPQWPEADMRNERRYTVADVHRWRERMSARGRRRPAGLHGLP